MDLTQLRELKQKLENEKTVSKTVDQKYVIVIGDNGYDFKSNFQNYDDERLLEEYEKIENTDEFIKQVESTFEIITMEAIKNDISFDKISMKTEVGCLCTPLFKEKIFLRMKNNINFINGNWYEAIPTVENSDNLYAKDNISNRYVPIMFSWTLGNFHKNNNRHDVMIYGLKNNYSEFFDNKISKKIVGIVDFNKFLYNIKDVLGYDIFMDCCGKENVQITNFEDYLNKIINSSYSVNYAGLFLNADFKKNNKIEKNKVLRRR